MSPSIFLMLHNDLFASPITKSHIYIRNQTTHQGQCLYLSSLVFLNIHLTKKILKICTNLWRSSKKIKIRPPVNKPKSINSKNENTNLAQSPKSKDVSTKVGNQFLKFINKHFPRHRKFHKLFNKNNVNISYSCTPNMKNINTYNKKTINPSKDNIAKVCKFIMYPNSIYI